MKSFLRENPTIAFGLGLPLLLVAAFLLISGIPALLVEPPQYDVLYATDLLGYQGGVQISVVNKKVQVVHRGNSQTYQQIRLWRYSPKNGGVKEIPIPLPPGLNPPTTTPLPSDDASKIIPIEVPDLAGLTVESSSIAPDGYEFTAEVGPYAGGLFTELFGGRNLRHAAVLTKSGRSVRVPNAGSEYYGQSTRLIGWIVAP